MSPTTALKLSSGSTLQLRTATIRFRALGITNTDIRPKTSVIANSAPE